MRVGRVAARLTHAAEALLAAPGRRQGGVAEIEADAFVGAVSAGLMTCATGTLIAVTERPPASTAGAYRDSRSPLLGTFWAPASDATAARMATLHQRRTPPRLPGDSLPGDSLPGNRQGFGKRARRVLIVLILGNRAPAP